MPVIACPDCGREVSTLAPACPHCGRPSPAAAVGTPAPAVTPAAPVREETLWRGGPSPILLAGYVIAIVATLVLIPLVVRFFAATEPDASRATGLMRFGWSAAAILAMIELIALIVAWVRLRSTSYTVTNQRVIVEQGIFSKHVDELDLRYVDDSQFQQTFTQRLLGIGNVTLLSSDRTTPRTLLRAVRDPRGLREIVRAQAYQASQRHLFTRER